MSLPRRAIVSRFCMAYYLYSLLFVLMSCKVSNATFNPAYNPQTQTYRHEQSTQDVNFNGQQNVEAWDESYPRGGSTMTAEPPQQEEPFQPPKINLKHMSMALRLTSEWNRRLLDGVNRVKFWGKPERIQNRQPSQQQQPEQQRKEMQEYGSQPVNVHPSRSWHPPIREPSQELTESELTLFHAKTPRSGGGGGGTSSNVQRRGVARWGPELLPYLEHVVELLEISDGVEIPLAMIYLDRACSVETPRSNGVPPCPFCTPRTAHRLTLAALLLARQAVAGTDTVLEESYVKLQSLGIPTPQLRQMVDWMRGALGDVGLLVTVGQMKEWSQTWDSIFYPRQRPQIQLNQHQQQSQPQPQQIQPQQLQHQVQYEQNPSTYDGDSGHPSQQAYQ